MVDAGADIARVTPSQIAAGIAEMLRRDLATLSESETLTIYKSDGSSITVGRAAGISDTFGTAVGTASDTRGGPPITLTTDTLRGLLNAIGSGSLAYVVAPDEAKAAIVLILILWCYGLVILDDK
jgi:hypothetical protein